MRRPGLGPGFLRNGPYMRCRRNHSAAPLGAGVRLLHVAALACRPYDPPQLSTYCWSGPLLMLQAIRSKAGSLIVKILFALLIVSFGVWGIGDIFRERSAAETTVASVGDINIQADELQIAVRREMSRMSGLCGGNFGTEQAKQLGLVDSVLNRIVASDLLDLEERRLRPLA